MKIKVFHIILCQENIPICLIGSAYQDESGELDFSATQSAADLYSDLLVDRVYAWIFMNKMANLCPDLIEFKNFWEEYSYSLPENSLKCTEIDTFTISNDTDKEQQEEEIDNHIGFLWNFLIEKGYRKK